MNPEGSPSPAERGSPSECKITLKEKATFQLKEFLTMFVYLWLILALFAIHRSVILAEQHLNYQAQGFAIVNALIMAKVMLIGEDLKVGNRFREKPLVYSILYKSLVFAVFLICFHIFEEVVVGVFRGKTVAQSLATIGGGGLQGIVSVAAIVFVSVIPFFAFREIGRVIGKRELWSVLLGRGSRVYTLQSRPQQ
jgi:hypothetical protein